MSDYKILQGVGVLVVASGLGCSQPKEPHKIFHARANVQSIEVSECPSGYNIIEGTAGDDVLNGTNGSDCILGYGGNDTIDGGNGDDVLSGGPGDDTINGGNGADQLLGGPGSDSLDGGNGDDVVSGGEGDDQLSGGRGADALYGDAGNDFLNGGSGTDASSGGDGNDWIVLSRGNDTVDGGVGVDTCDGTSCEQSDPSSGTCEVDDDCPNAWQRCVASMGVCVYCQSNLECDDGNDCTADSCDPFLGCANTTLPAGTTCGEGDLCSGVGACDAQGVCIPGVPPIVDDGNPCTTDYCDPELGVVTDPVAAGTSCSDGDACNGDEVCDDAAVCTDGTPPAIDDGNPCTTDGCDASVGPYHTALAFGAACGDDDACNGDETCDGIGTCVPGTTPQVDDGNPCTTDGCDASAGTYHIAHPFGAACGDGDACNGDETCDGIGTCMPGTAPQVDDGNPCTEDLCLQNFGVVHVPLVGLSCSDGDVCNGEELCDTAGTCTAGEPLLEYPCVTELETDCVDTSPPNAEPIVVTMLAVYDDGWQISACEWACSSGYERILDTCVEEGKPLLVTRPLLVDRDGEAVLTRVHMQALNPDLTQADIKYYNPQWLLGDFGPIIRPAGIQWTRNLAHGMLVSPQPGNGNYIYQSRINGEYISYRHGGDAADVDSMPLILHDNTWDTVGPNGFFIGNEIGVNGTLEFKIVDPSENFYVNTNEVLAIDKDTTTTGMITPDHLSAVALTQTPEAVVYSLDSSPSSGNLMIDGQIVTSFTQADINAGALTYEYVSWYRLDSFLFTVSNGLGEHIGQRRFNIEMRSASFLEILSGGPIVVPKLTTKTVGISELWVRDSESSEVFFDILSPPAYGTIKVRGTEATRFSATDIALGVLTYTHRFYGEAREALADEIVVSVFCLPDHPNLPGLVLH